MSEKTLGKASNLENKNSVSPFTEYTLEDANRYNLPEKAPESKTKNIKKDVVLHNGEKKELSYTAAEYNLTELYLLTKNEKDKLHNKLGLKDIHFSIFKNEQQQPKENEKRNVYVLAHGWTANHKIFSEVEDAEGLSFVEQILKEDPTAIIITPDGNGFGETNFRDDIKVNELKNFCRVERYADQLELLLNSLDIPLSEVSFAGHSMGGAAVATEIARRGAKKVVALAPAIVPTKTSVDEAEAYSSKIGINIQDKKTNKTANTYRVLSAALSLGERVSDFGNKRINQVSKFVAKGAVSKIFEKIGPYLMGKSIYENPNVDTTIIEKLAEIHDSEVSDPSKLAVSAEAIKQLQETGVDFTKWEISDAVNDFESFFNVTTFPGAEDKLVFPEELELTYSVALSLGHKKAQEYLNTINASKMEAGEKEQRKHQIENFLRKAREKLQEIKSRDNFTGGGHYSPMFNNLMIAELIKS